MHTDQTVDRTIRPCLYAQENLTMKNVQSVYFSTAERGEQNGTDKREDSGLDVRR